jgi:hypothetical protein
VGAAGLSGRAGTISTQSDGRLTVEVYQHARNLAGDLLWDGPARHVYELRDGLIARMDIEEIAAGG